MARIRLAFIGDVMLGRGVDDRIGVRRPESFWGSTLPVLRSADAVIANLECAITAHETPWMETYKVFHFRAGPAGVDVLQAANVRCVSLANNHTLDFETQGLLDTVRYLDEAKIRHAGAGKNISAARSPALLDVGGARVAFIAMTDNEPAFAAGISRPGTNYAAIGFDPEAAEVLVRQMEEAHRSSPELIILSLHWGPNMVDRPPPRFIEFAHAAVDLGVDVIYGHSAHIFQGIEVYHGGLIMYDTGDFLDDYAVDPELRNDWSFVFLVEVEDGVLTKLRTLPVRLSFTVADLASGDEFEEIRERMRERCRQFDTAIVATPEGLSVDIAH